MTDRKDAIKPTVVLNRNNSDGFLDFHSSSDLREVIKVVKKHMGEDHSGD